MFQCLKFLQAAPKAPRITNKDEIDDKYRHWRLRVMYSMYISYACFYFTRKSFTFAMPEMINSLHFSKADMGILGSVFYIMYGVSKFISGVLSDKSNPKYFMSIGLIMTGVVNIVFGFSTSLMALMILWLLNGFFQGWGWPPCARLLTHWYSKKERGLWWSIWNTSHNFGAALIPVIVAYCAIKWGWRGAMFVPGIIAIVIGVITINRLSDVPESHGLPPIEEYKNDYPEGHKVKTKEISTKKILIDYILKNRYIWILAISYVLVYIVRTAINDWAAVFLNEKGNSLMSSDSSVSFFEIGGFFGSLLAGWASDKIFAGGRGQVNVLFSIGILLSIFAFWLTPHGGFWVNAACLFAIGFLVFGPQMLIGVAAAELSYREAAGAATGFVGLFAYLGAALSGYPIGVIIQRFGWDGFFVSIAVCALLTVGLLAFLWSARTCPVIAAPEEEEVVGEPVPGFGAVPQPEGAES
jgi:MFS transporter, OPA family, sugar phosphate sensor protein UhpC